MFGTANTIATVFVGDLAVSCDENHLYGMFIEYGPIYSIKLMRTRKHLSLGYAFVALYSMEKALLAINNLNGKPLCGRNIRTAFASQSQDLTKYDKSTVYFGNYSNELIPESTMSSAEKISLLIQLPAETPMEYLNSVFFRYVISKSMDNYDSIPLSESIIKEVFNSRFVGYDEMHSLLSLGGEDGSGSGSVLDATNELTEAAAVGVGIGGEKGEYVLDVTIRRMSENAEAKKGYGFIHFRDMDCCVYALQHCGMVYHGGITYTLEVSKSLEKQLGGDSQSSSEAASAVPSGYTSRTASQTTTPKYTEDRHFFPMPVHAAGGKPGHKVNPSANPIPNLHPGMMTPQQLQQQYQANQQQMLQLQQQQYRISQAQSAYELSSGGAAGGMSLTRGGRDAYAQHSQHAPAAYTPSVFRSVPYAAAAPVAPRPYGSQPYPGGQKPSRGKLASGIPSQYMNPRYHSGGHVGGGNPGSSLYHASVSHGGGSKDGGLGGMYSDAAYGSAAPVTGYSSGGYVYPMDGTGRGGSGTAMGLNTPHSLSRHGSGGTGMTTPLDFSRHGSGIRKSSSEEDSFPGGAALPTVTVTGILDQYSDSQFDHWFQRMPSGEQDPRKSEGTTESSARPSGEWGGLSECFDLKALNMDALIE